jgi:hypothetical protein
MLRLKRNCALNQYVGVRARLWCRHEDRLRFVRVLLIRIDIDRREHGAKGCQRREIELGVAREV